MKEYYLSFVRVWGANPSNHPSNSALETIKVQDVQYIGQGIDGCIVWLKDGRSLKVTSKGMIRVHQ